MKEKNFKNLIKKIKSNIFPILNKIKHMKKRNIYIIIAAIFFILIYIFFGKESIFVEKNAIKREDIGKSSKDYSLYFSNDSDLKNEKFDFTIEPKKMSTEEALKYFDVLYEEALPKILNTNANFKLIDSDLNLPTSYPNGVSAKWGFELVEEKNLDYIKKYQNLIESSGKVNNEDFTDYDEVDGYLTTQFSIDVNDSDMPLKSNIFLTEVRVIKKKLRKQKKQES